MRQKGQDDWEDESSKGWHILGEVVCGRALGARVLNGVSTALVRAVDGDEIELTSSMLQAVLASRGSVGGSEMGAGREVISQIFINI
jgi:hypothetical protein